MGVRENRSLPASAFGSSCTGSRPGSHSFGAQIPMATAELLLAFIVLSLAALIVTYHFVQPAPPHHIVLATGQEGGAYYLFGLHYQALLAREGIDVTVRPTSGSVENIQLLQNGQADVAFVQGGTGTSVDAPSLRAL